MRSEDVQENEILFYAIMKNTGIQITDTSFFLSMENTPLLRSEMTPESRSGESKQNQTLAPSKDGVFCGVDPCFNRPVGQLEQNQMNTSSVKEEMSVTPSGTTVDVAAMVLYSY